MAYILDGLIEAVDYNTFSDDAADVYGIGNGDFGYGQNAAPNPSPFPLINVPVGKLVEAQEWEDFVNAVEICASHQGTVTNPDPFTDLLPEVAVGEIVEAHEQDAPTSDPFDVDSSIAAIRTNRLNFDAGSVSIFANELNSARGTAWSNEIEHRFTTIHPTADDARFFYNSGGQIRIRGSRSGGSSTPQNTAWTDLLDDMKTVIFGVHSTTSTGSADFIASGIGYFELTTSFQLIFSLESDSGSYTTNVVTIEARTMDTAPIGPNGDNGRRLEFRVKYSDLHTSYFSDTIDGTITSDIDMQKATFPLVLVSTNNPAFTTVVPLTSGS